MRAWCGLWQSAHSEWRLVVPNAPGSPSSKFVWRLVMVITGCRAALSSGVRMSRAAGPFVSWQLRQRLSSRSTSRTGKLVDGFAASGQPCAKWQPEHEPRSARFDSAGNSVPYWPPGHSVAALVAKKCDAGVAVSARRWQDAQKADPLVMRSRLPSEAALRCTSWQVWQRTLPVAGSSGRLVAARYNAPVVITRPTGCEPRAAFVTLRGAWQSRQSWPAWLSATR